MFQPASGPRCRMAWYALAISAGVAIITQNLLSKTNNGVFVLQYVETKAATAFDQLSAKLAAGEKMARRRHQAPTIFTRSNGTKYIRPWVDVIRPDGSRGREKRVITLDDATTIKTAQKVCSEKMGRINTPDIVLVSNIEFNELLKVYDDKHIETQLGYGTQKKYRLHIANHIAPFFGKMTLNEMSKSLVIQEFFDMKKAAGLSWSTRMDIRNVLSGVFERAEFWGFWKMKNPVRGVKIGKKEFIYVRREWTIEETRALLAALPYDVRILCFTALLTTLRISELLGLKEKHVKGNTLHILERYYRGNTAQTKSKDSARQIPIDSWLLAEMKKLCLGDPEHYIFNIQTYPAYGRQEALCRDDRSIHRYFLKPAAVELGLYQKGFGFHDLRREAVTEYEDRIGLAQTSKIAGHATQRMTTHYVKKDSDRIREAMGAYTDQLMGPG